jgi:hypothetical protein
MSAWLQTRSKHCGAGNILAAEESLEPPCMRPTILILYDVLEDDVSSFVLQSRPDSLKNAAVRGIRRGGGDDESTLELLKC